MKTFKDLKVGDTIFKIFYLKKEVNGFCNFQKSATVIEIELDLIDPNVKNIICEYDNGFMEFDISLSELDKTSIIDNNDTWIEIITT